ncbi:carbohydrate porin, partial [Colwellia demingiae]
MKTSIPLLGLLLASSTTAWAATETTKIERLEQLEKQVAELKKEVNTNTKTTTDLTPKIKVGGAVRFQYSYEDYDDDNKDRGGDFDFDVFRLDVNGSIGDVKLSAQYRWYQYMNVIHHADVAY